LAEPEDALVDVDAVGVEPEAEDLLGIEHNVRGSSREEKEGCAGEQSYRKAS
jgi:hypothetical protein